MKKLQIVPLSPPLLAPEYIKERIICIRAHRERIFNVSTQAIEDKLIFHNYGQGGAGWTFLFGCANESIRQFEQQIEQNNALQKKPIVIIGAGCYGLLTAIILARKGYNIRIIAKDTQNIPSDMAAGFFFPRPRKCAKPDEIAIYQMLGIESYSHYLQIIAGTHPFIKQGPELVSAYYGLDIDPGFNPYISQGLTIQPQEVMIDFNTGKTFHAMEYKTVFINSSALMQELRRCASELQIPITHTEISDFNEIPEAIIFNCSNLGAKKLTRDPRLIPVQGHLITLQNQPPLDYMIHGKVIQMSPQGHERDELIYYAPKENGILGITFIRGEDSLTNNQHEFDRLLQRSRDFFGT